MPKLSYRQPRYCRHRDRAVVYINGKSVSLGKYGSAESKAAYKRLMVKWNAGQGISVISMELPADVATATAPMVEVPLALTVVELIKRYRDYARSYYVKDGKQTSEVQCIDSAASFLRRWFGRLPAEEFSPLKLKTVRESMVVAKLSRTTINQNINRIRRMFKWAAAEELIPGSVHENLKAVEGLKSGRCEARDSEPVLPIDMVVVEATLPFLSPVVADMIRVQELTGMRPGEVCQLRPRISIGRATCGVLRCKVTRRNIMASSGSWRSARKPKQS
ncbi:MAG: hypothetical protein FJ295_21220 [Planctomycetes bacterium]|nr:hypothetical protein [Planctomycetota bacterium]